MIPGAVLPKDINFGHKKKHLFRKACVWLYRTVSLMVGQFRLILFVCIFFLWRFDHMPHGTLAVQHLFKFIFVALFFKQLCRSPRDSNRGIHLLQSTSMLQKIASDQRCRHGFHGDDHRPWRIASYSICLTVADTWPNILTRDVKESLVREPDYFCSNVLTVVAGKVHTSPDPICESLPINALNNSTKLCRLTLYLLSKLDG